MILAADRFDSERDFSRSLAGRGWSLAWAIAVLSAVIAGQRARAADPAPIRAAAEKSLALLQRCSPEFFRQTGCVACHQHSVTSLAVAEARRRGLAVDEDSARQQLRVTALVVKSMRSRFLQRVDHPINSAPSAGYIALGLAAEKYPADENTDAMIVELAGRQTAEGSWTAFGHRPPLEYSRVAATALAVRALSSYGPPGLKASFERRIERARAWLVAVAPKSNTEHAFRLLGLAWSGADKGAIAAETAALESAQHADGGWSQMSQPASDAYATAVTLYALHDGGRMPATDPVYLRGVAHLVKTQRDDGSWHVKSHSLPFQPYFESGFPHGPDQWISAAATGFAATALIRALSESVAGTR